MFILLLLDTNTLAQSTYQEDVFQLIHQGSFRAASKLMDSVLVNPSPNLTTEAHFAQLALAVKSARMAGRMKTLKRKLEAYELSYATIIDTSDVEKDFLLQMALGHAILKSDKTLDLLNRLESLLEGGAELDPIQSIMYHFAAGQYAQMMNPDPAKVVQHYNQAILQHGDSFEFKLLKSQVYKWFGIFYRGEADFEKGTEMLENEILLLQEILPSNNFSIAAAHYNLANIFYELNNYDKALLHYLSAYPAWKNRFELGHRYRRFIEEGIGDMYWEKNMKDSALVHYNYSIIGDPEINNDPGLSLLDQADSSQTEGQLNVALKYYEKALEMRKEAYGENHHLTGACNNFVGRVYRELGHQEAALSIFQNSLYGLASMEEKTDLCYNPSAVRFNKGSARYAIEALIAKATLMMELTENHSEDYLHCAQNALQTGIQIIDLIRQRPISKEAKIFWTELAIPLYEFAIEVSHKMYQRTNDAHYLDTAFIAIEKSKAFLFMSAMQNDKLLADVNVPFDILEKEHDLRNQLSTYEGRALKEQARCSEKRPKKLDIWLHKLQETEVEYAALIKTIEEDYPDYFNYKYDFGNKTIDELKQIISKDANTLFLNYFEGNEHIFLFAISQEKTKFYSFPLMDTFHLKCDSLLHILNNRAVNQFRNYSALSSFFYETYLLPALKDYPERNNLLISPYGRMTYMPFSAFITNHPAASSYHSANYLLEDYSISYVPSASFINSVQDSKKQPWSYAGFAPQYHLTNDSSSLTPLQYNTVEIEQAKTVFNLRATLYTTDATKENFEYAANKTSVLHLSMHAALNESEPLLSTLHFQSTEKDDGRMFAYELSGMHLDCSMSVLSACNTGNGKWQRGEGINSLARSFQYAGCPNMIASLWQIDDMATASIIQSFYKNIKENNTIGEALQKAKLNYLQNADPVSAHPFYWAGMTFIGQDDHLPLNSGFNIPYVWIIIFVTIIFVIALMVKRK